MDLWVWFPNLNYLEWFSGPPLAEKISLSAATESFIYYVVAYEACNISFFDDVRNKNIWHYEIASRMLQESLSFLKMS